MGEELKKEIETAGKTDKVEVSHLTKYFGTLHEIGRASCRERV